VPSHFPEHTLPSPTHCTRRAPAWGAPVTAEQLPSWPATSQASHWPSHAELQQKLSTQCPLEHWRSPLQPWPFGRCGVHTPAEQKWPVAHCPSIKQLPMHCEGPHVDGAQSCVSTAGHLPSPRQKASSVATPLVQLAARQRVLEPGSVQAARSWPPHVPLQRLESPAHAVRAPCGAPTTAEQVPLAAPPVSHASHCPVHGVSQQTPSTHKPELHDSSTVHALPSGSFGTHTPPLQ